MTATIFAAQSECRFAAVRAAAAASIGAVTQADLAGRLFQEAEACLEGMQVAAALRLFAGAENAGFDPDACAASRWNCYMLLGDFESAWKESDAIAGRGWPDPQRFWNGAPFDGKNVLLRCLHGLGDTLQFVRYAPFIRQRARSLTIEAQPVLKRLLRASRLADRIITWGEPEPPWDQQMEVNELPRIFRTTANTIPYPGPYIASGGGAQHAAKSGDQFLRVGLVWAASSYNVARCIRLADLGGILSLPGVRFFSLQGGPERTQLKECQFPIVDSEGDSVCLVPLATLVVSLDLVITVDTMMAHLAGSMGLPVWTMLPFRCDWRWMMQRADSPWYPTMRLFRQARPGEWQPVVEQVRIALQSQIAALNLRVDAVHSQDARLARS